MCVLSLKSHSLMRSHKFKSFSWYKHAYAMHTMHITRVLYETLNREYGTYSVFARRGWMSANCKFSRNLVFNKYIYIYIERKRERPCKLSKRNGRQTVYDFPRSKF